MNNAYMLLFRRKDPFLYTDVSPPSAPTGSREAPAASGPAGAEPETAPETTNAAAVADAAASADHTAAESVASDASSESPSSSDAGGRPALADESSADASQQTASSSDASTPRRKFEPVAIPATIPESAPAEALPACRAPSGPCFQAGLGGKPHVLEDLQSVRPAVLPVRVEARPLAGGVRRVAGGALRHAGSSPFAGGTGRDHGQRRAVSQQQGRNREGFLRTCAREPKPALMCP